MCSTDHSCEQHEREADSRKNVSTQKSRDRNITQVFIKGADFSGRDLVPEDKGWRRGTSHTMTLLLFEILTPCEPHLSDH